jgi:hypothetical protein
MKKMSKTRNKENLLPFHIIKAASEGDVSAINAVLKHYEGYKSNCPQESCMTKVDRYITALMKLCVAD